MFSPPIFLCYYWLVLVFLLNFVALDVLSAADEFVFNQFTSTPSINVVAPMFIGQVVLATLFAACPEIFECSPPPLKKRPPIGRERRSVRSIMNELGELSRDPFRLRRPLQTRPYWSYRQRCKTIRNCQWVLHRQNHLLRRNHHMGGLYSTMRPTGAGVGL